MPRPAGKSAGKGSSKGRGKGRGPGRGSQPARAAGEDADVEDEEDALDAPEEGEFEEAEVEQEAEPAGRMSQSRRPVTFGIDVEFDEDALRAPTRRRESVRVAGEVPWSVLG